MTACQAGGQGQADAQAERGRAAQAPALRAAAGRQEGAAAQRATARRAEQKRRTEAMRRGEEWALPARDRGAVRALARDYVDSRRLVVSEYILFAVFVADHRHLHARRGQELVGRSCTSRSASLGIIAVESMYHGAR